MSLASLDLETKEELKKLFSRYSNLPSEMILSEANLFLALTPKLFKQHRSPKHLARIICSLCWLRHQLGEKGHLLHPTTLFRVIPSMLSFPFGCKQTLGLCVGVSHLGEYQLFTEKNILHAVSVLFPQAQLVEQSPLLFQRPQDTTVCLYAEVEKFSATPFTLAEIKKLKFHLQQSLPSSIEQLMPTLVPLRNEEEKMKDVVSLRGEIHSLDDPPQVVIHLEEQAPLHLTFAITLVRPVGKGTPPLPQLFKNLSSEWTYIHQKTEDVSLSQDKCRREVHFFWMQLNDLTSFTRADSTINLPLIRQHLVNALTHHLGPIRDYAGGMIALQNTLFAHLQEQYSNIDVKLLEDFYYNLAPTETLLTLPNTTVNTLLDLILDLQQAPTQDNPIGKKKELSDHIYTALLLPKSFPDQLLRVNLPHHSQIVTTTFCDQGHKILAFITPSENSEFLPTLEKDLNTLLSQDPSTQTLKLCTEIFPISLDPRITLLSSTNHIFKMLFDGLMRLDAEGVPQCAVAKSIHISRDRKTYTFKLRESYWNNGDPVTAHDFAYTWKKILSPTFKTPYAYLFYLIYNAKEAKRGDLPIDTVGIYAPDPQTLIVNLELPAPYFLNYLALSLFFPVNHRIDQMHPNWHLATSSDYICNGPFSLSTITPGRSLHLTKNPNYWDHPNVHLQAIHIDIAQSSTILERFRNNQVDWIGPPITHSNPSSKLSAPDKEKHSLNYFATHWLMVNTKRFPLNNKKFRQAFSSAIDRQALVNCLSQAEAVPAYSPLPPAYSTLVDPPGSHNEQRAQKLLTESLQEMHLSLSDLQEIPILVATETQDLRYNLLLQLQSQVNQILGVNIKLEPLKWGLACEKIQSEDYLICIGNWQYPTNTPFYFLDVLSSPQKGDFHQWTSDDYQSALGTLRAQFDLREGDFSIKEIESILIDEMPIIPLLHEFGRCMHSQRMKNMIWDTELALLDFKEAVLTHEVAFQWIVKI